MRVGVVTEISFSLGKSTPLSAYTGNVDDKYEMLKPLASAKMTLTEQADPSTKEGRAKIEQGYNELRELCLEQLADFHKSVYAKFNPKG